MLAEGCGDRHDDDEQADDTDPANPDPAARRFVLLGWGSRAPVKAARCCRHVCGFRYADDMRRLRSIERMRVLIVEDEPYWRKPSAMACAWRRSRPTSPVTATPLWSC